MQRISTVVVRAIDERRGMLEDVAERVADEGRSTTVGMIASRLEKVVKHVLARMISSLEIAAAFPQGLEKQAMRHHHVHCLAKDCRACIVSTAAEQGSANLAMYM